MKKLILVPAFVFGVMALATAQTTTTTTTTTTAPTTSGGQIGNGPVMTFDVMTYDFGKIKQGDVVTKEFKFKNTGKEPLIINEAHGSCGCTVPDYPKEPIKPNGEAVIKVTFNSAGKMNQQDKTVTITYDNDQTCVLHLTGMVEAPAAAASTGTATQATGTGTAAPATTTTAPKSGTTTTTTTTTPAPKTVSAGGGN